MADARLAIHAGTTWHLEVKHERVDESGRTRIHIQRLPADTALTPYAALFLRVTLSWFFCAHLYNKFFTRDGFHGWWHALTGSHPVYVPIYVLTVEFSCALLLPLGIRTRWVALYAMPSFIGIIHFWFRIGGYWFTNPGAEFPIAWACMLILQIILGDGAYSLKFSSSSPACA